MECHAARQRLIDLLEAGADSEEGRALAEHVGNCPRCRAELEALKRGQEALVQSLEELAPARAYLTHARMRRLHKALAERTPSRLIPSLRVLVACASVAAIIVSGVFIYQSAASLLRPPAVPQPRGTPVYAKGGVETAFPPVQIGLAASPQQERLHIVQGYAQLEDTEREAWSTPDAATPRAHLVLTSSPGVDVPVENILYDSEQAAYWW